MSDTNETAAAPEAVQPKPKRNLAPVILGVAVLVAAAFGAQRWMWSRNHVETDNAQVEGSVVPALARVPGFVAEVAVKENQAVAAGDLLVRLDDRELKAKLQQSEADLAAALANAGEKGRTGLTEAQLAAARAQVAQAEAAVATLDATLANSRILAPFAGVVTLRHREPGEIAGAGAAVVTLMNPDDRWVRIYVPENRLGRVALGAAAEITSDTFPGKRYAGEVAFIASSAEFTPKNVQTTEERVKLVYAVKVRITGDPSQELKPGLPADVRLVEGP